MAGEPPQPERSPTPAPGDEAPAPPAPPAPGEPGAAGDPGAPHPAEDALDSAAQAAEKLAAETGSGSAAPMPDLGGAAAAGAPAAVATDLGLLGDVDLKVKIELGRTRMYVEDVLRLNASSVIELDKAAGDPVDIFVNDRHVARGEVLVVNESFCVRVSEIIHQPAAGD